jgi:thiol-disulfide isomerase/thioredoxin
MKTKSLPAAAAALLLLIAARDARAQTGYEEVSPEVLSAKFKSLSGDAPVTLTGPRRRVTVLLIWASWCKPCREAAEGLDLSNPYPGDARHYALRRRHKTYVALDFLKAALGLITLGLWV